MSSWLESNSVYDQGGQSVYIDRDNGIRITTAETKPVTLVDRYCPRCQKHTSCVAVNVAELTSSYSAHPRKWAGWRCTVCGELHKADTKFHIVNGTTGKLMSR